MTNSIVNNKTHWFQKPLNILQTNIREIDAKDYRVNDVIKYMQDTSCNTLVINAGGIVDFFQNPLPAGMTNEFMGDRDILMEISSACKAAGIRVIARIDFRGAEEKIYKKFPDWFMVNEKGEPVITRYDYRGRTLTLYAGCYLGKHRTVYMRELINYIMSEYPIDGIWHNAPGSPGICYCEACKNSYRESIGKELPKDHSAMPDEIDEYMRWKVGIADQHMHGIKELIKSFGEDKIYCAEIFSMYNVESRVNSGIDLNNARAHFDFLVSVAFQDSGDSKLFYQNFNYAGTITRFLKSMAPEREAIVLCGGNGTIHRMVSDPKVDFKTWLWIVLASGGRWWNNYFTNIPNAAYDRRNIYDHKDAFQFVQKHEKLLERHAPVSNIGIYYSRPTRLSFRNKSVDDYRFGDEIRGIETVLLENHIPHDFILHDQLTREKIDTYSLVILANVRCMAENEIGLIRTYVRDGGNLIATYCSSLYDENGIQRNDFGLSDVFGVQFSGIKTNTRRDSFQYILNRDHSLVKSEVSNTELLFNSGFTCLVKADGSAQVVCTLVPPIQNQPPDKSWVEKFSTEYPTVVEHQFGKGRVFYFANQPDLLSYESGHQDVRNLLLRCIRDLVGFEIPIQTNAPSSIQMGLTKSQLKEGEYIVSLVNTTSSAVRPIKRLIPVENIRVKLRLNGKSVSSWKVLRAQGKCYIKKSGQELDILFSKIEDFSAVHVIMNK